MEKIIRETLKNRRDTREIMDSRGTREAKGNSLISYNKSFRETLKNRLDTKEIMGSRGTREARGSSLMSNNIK